MVSRFILDPIPMCYFLLKPDIVDGGTCEYGELRLVGGTSDREGRVEICIGGLWGTICDDNYDRLDATVICRQLGFNTAG